MIEVRILTTSENNILPLFKIEKYRRISEKAMTDILTGRKDMFTVSSTYVSEEGRFTWKRDDPIFIAKLRDRYQLEKGCDFEFQEGESYD